MLLKLETLFWPLLKFIRDIMQRFSLICSCILPATNLFRVLLQLRMVYMFLEFVLLLAIFPSMQKKNLSFYLPSYLIYVNMYSYPKLPANLNLWFYPLTVTFPNKPWLVYGLLYICNHGYVCYFGYLVDLWFITFPSGQWPPNSKARLISNLYGLWLIKSGIIFFSINYWCFRFFQKTMCNWYIYRFSMGPLVLKSLEYIRNESAIPPTPLFDLP